jgi:hypothetical protein
MPREPDRARVVALIAAARAEPQASRLAATLGDRCWPGGGADRTEPAARAWVRRWRPERFAAVLVGCTCPEGRCAVCN